jgi:ribosomal-protein-alanine N-acetyltransferase
MAGPLPGASADELTVTVEPMHERHLPGVLRIERQVHPRPWSESLFVGELALRGSRVYAVAMVGRTVVGYAGVLFMADDAHVTNVAVDPAWQRRGIGTRLVLVLARAVSARGVDQITLEVRVSNAGAQELYRRFGFAPGGVRKGYYVDNREDALVMWAHEVRSDDYVARLAAIEAGIPGFTATSGFDLDGAEHPAAGS